MGNGGAEEGGDKAPLRLRPVIDTLVRDGAVLDRTAHLLDDSAISLKDLGNACHKLFRYGVQYG